MPRQAASIEHGDNVEVGIGGVGLRDLLPATGFARLLTLTAIPGRGGESLWGHRVFPPNRNPCRKRRSSALLAFFLRERLAVAVGAQGMGRRGFRLRISVAAPFRLAP